ncbi:hypothetical protein PVK06_047967 [Gossypium arboreum]|uniref:Auxin-responsive protein n=1 Tax=Gossypium arboreum TaxID=29729 RepID=A0ABR0MGM2_GOSAR|nr:hypothetical protein PVK06_047967 [Gossypium arboreum]
MSAEEERLWSILRANSLDFNAWTALIEETEKVAEAHVLKENGNLLELVDTRIGSDCNIDEVLMDMINIALLRTMILSDKTRFMAQAVEGDECHFSSMASTEAAPRKNIYVLLQGNWTWEHAKLKARMQTLQRNLRYPPMASNFRYIQGMHLSLLINKKCDEDDYILTYQDKEGEWLIGGDIPWHYWCQLDEANISIAGVFPRRFKTGFREGTEAAPRKKVAAASA